MIFMTVADNKTHIGDMSVFQTENILEESYSGHLFPNDIEGGFT